VEIKATRGSFWWPQWRPVLKEFVPTGIPEAAHKVQKPNNINDFIGLEVGRRDWTRTNDPHHVKVVL
jgi:hypothetical protein